MIVLDAAAVLDQLLGREPRASWVDGLVARSGQSLHAPHVIDIEVANALRRYVLMGEASEARGRRALAAFLALRLKRYPHTALLERIWELRGSLTASDAAYVALAEALDAPLVTTDERLGRAPGHRARVQAFPAV